MAALVPLAMKKCGMNVSSHPATIHTPGKLLTTESPLERITIAHIPDVRSQAFRSFGESW
ncbi:hypothetical protein VB757_00865 [Synechococcus sp. BA-132 BA5]|nr:hypothetical protein [Synechococcus sp. BA-132 BA5]